MPFGRFVSTSAPASRFTPGTYSDISERPRFSVNAVSPYSMVWFWHEKALKGTAQRPPESHQAVAVGKVVGHRDRDGSILVSVPLLPHADLARSRRRSQ